MKDIFVFRNKINVLLVLLVLFTVMQAAYASSAVQTQNQCSITVDIGSPGGLEKSSVMVDIYKVATGSTSSQFQIEGSFQSTASKDAALSETIKKIMDGTASAQEWENAAQAAACIAYGVEDGKKADVFKSVEASEKGAAFTGLQPGIYMISARGKGIPAGSFVMTEAGKAASYAETEKYVYEWLPVLVAVPQMENGKPVYSVISRLKPSIGDKTVSGYAELKVEKTLEKYNGKPVNFTFTAEVYENEAAYQKKAEPLKTHQVSIRFSGTGKKTAQIKEKIPEGSCVVVYENKPEAPYMQSHCSMLEVLKDGKEIKTDAQNGKAAAFCVKDKSVLIAKFANTLEKEQAKPGKPDDSDTPDKPVSPDKPDKPDIPDRPDSPDGEKPGIHNNQGNPDGNAADGKPVKTGDSPVLWILLLGIVFGIAGIMLYKSKNKK